MIRLTAVDLPQAYRYMGMQAEPDERMQSLAADCEKRLLAAVLPRYIHVVCPIRETPDGILCEGTTLLLTGKDIAAHLSGCDRAVILCATLSAGADAAIRQAGASDVLAGMMTDAMASALTEQLSDALIFDIFDVVLVFVKGISVLSLSLVKVIVIKIAHRKHCFYLILRQRIVIAADFFLRRTQHGIEAFGLGVIGRVIFSDLFSL